MIKYLTIVAFLFQTLGIAAAKPFQCTIYGNVINRNSKRLLLVKATDRRYANKRYIPIINHRFSYTFKVKEIEAYQLIFEEELEAGNWNEVLLFPIPGTVKVNLYPQTDFNKDQVIGGRLNQDYTNYQQFFNSRFQEKQDAINSTINILIDKNEYYSKFYDSLRTVLHQKENAVERQAIYDKFEKLRASGDMYSSKGKLLRQEEDTLNTNEISYRYQYIKKHQTLLSYYFLLEDVYQIKGEKTLLQQIRQTYPKFAALFSQHSYTTTIGNELAGNIKIQPGEPFINFIATDLKGKRYELNTLVKDKLTIIDFWGSWCGSCIAKTRSIIPIYQEFKNKGLHIVGIAREFKTTKNLLIALRREKYPWLNLLELNDKNQIWNKYGISSQGGMLILVNKNGKIILVDPTAEEVKQAVIANL